MISENQIPPPHSTGASIPKIQYLEGFTFLFKDSNWANNLLIGSVFNLVPFVGPILVLGWMCEIMQRLVKRSPNPIPKLDFADFVHYLQRGLVPFVVGLIVAIPFAILMVILIFISIGFSSLWMTPGGKPEPVFALILFGGIFGSIFFVGIPLAIFSNAGRTRAYLTEDFGQSLKIGKIFNYANNTWWPLLKACVVYIPLSYVLMAAGMILLYIGLFPAILIMNVAWLYLAWQIYEIYLAKGGEPIPMKPNPAPIPSETAAAHPASQSPRQ